MSGRVRDFENPLAIDEVMRLVDAEAENLPRHTQQRIMATLGAWAPIVRKATEENDR